MSDHGLEPEIANRSETAGKKIIPIPSLAACLVYYSHWIRMSQYLRLIEFFHFLILVSHLTHWSVDWILQSSYTCRSTWLFTEIVRKGLGPQARRPGSERRRRWQVVFGFRDILGTCLFFLSDYNCKVVGTARGNHLGRECRQYPVALTFLALEKRADLLERDCGLFFFFFADSCVLPAFFGSGILVGLNVALSWFGGTLFAWAILGPILVHYGECIGKQYGKPGTKWEGLVNFNFLDDIGEDGALPSPRYWFLWPGVMVLICYSLSEFLIHFRVLYDGIKFAFRGMASSVNNKMQARGKSNAFLEKQAAKLQDDSSLVEDFAPVDQQVPVWVWLSGSVIFLVVAIIVCELQFDVNAGLAILACLLGVVFAFLAIYGGAVTDVAPLTASSKASQLVYGGITKGHYEIHNAQRINLIAGNIASGTADVANALVSDFRVGFLLRTPPKLQFYAQGIGACVSIFLAPGIFVLFMSAYPCVYDQEVAAKLLEEQKQCPFQAPSVLAWQAVAQAVTQPNLPIPLSSGIFSIVMGVVCVLQALGKNLLLVGEREKFRKWLPNWMAIGVAWVLGADASYSFAVLFGSITAWWWKKYFSKNFDSYGFAVAAGLVAGEGLAGVVNAALTLGGVSGADVGTQIALPGYG